LNTEATERKIFWIVILLGTSPFSDKYSQG
jgi:hypothetical protein